MRVTRFCSILMLIVALVGCNDTNGGAIQSDKTPVEIDIAAEIITPSLRPHVDRSQFKGVPHYQIALDVDFDLFTYSGTQTLSFINQERDTLNELYFFVYPNTKELTNGQGRHLVVKNVKVDGVRTKAEDNGGPLLKVVLNSPMRPGQQAKIELDFKGVLYRQAPHASDLKKLAIEQLTQLVTGHNDHAGGYGVFSYGEGIVSMALWHPVLAAYDHNGWDVDPGTDMGDRSYFDVAHYDVTINVPQDVKVATSGVRSTHVSEPTQRRYVAAAVREFAIQMSKEYDLLSTEVGEVTVNSWFLKAHRSVGQSVLNQAAAALRVFERDFGPYPYRELDIAESPLVGGAGGVEFPGLVTVARMFYVDDLSPSIAPGPAAQRSNRMLDETREFVVAHEVAHQWWNAVVGSDSKRHPFIDEALANHSAIHYFDVVHGADAAEGQRELQLRLPWHVSRMSGGRDRPVDLATKDFNNMIEYAAVVYAKGGLFYDALRTRLGDEKFLKALQGYYSSFSFKIATPDDLTGVFMEAASNKVATRALIDRWLKERHASTDIASIKFTTVLRQLLDDKTLAAMDPKLKELLDHRGIKELGTLIKNLVGTDGRPRNDVDYAAILDLAGKLLGAQQDEIGRILGVTDRLMQRGDRLRAGDVVREVGLELAGPDPHAQKMVRAMGEMFDALGGSQR